MTPAGYQHIGFLRRFRVVAYVLVVLSILGFGFAEARPAPMMLGLLGCLLSWWVVETPGARIVPRWIINVGVLFSSFLLFWELVIMGQDNLLKGLGHFMIAIMICKLFETKQNRDYAQILTLSLLIMVAAAIFASQRLTFGVLLATYLTLGLYGILVFHLRYNTERALAGGSAPAEIVMSSENQRLLRVDMRRMAFRVSVLLAVFATTVFVLFPRNPDRSLFGGTDAVQQMGFSHHVRFHSFTTLLESDVPAMEVRIEIDGKPLAIGSNGLYFRGMVYTRYELSDPGWKPVAESWDQRLPMEIPLAPERGSSLMTQHYKMLTPSGFVMFSLESEPTGSRAAPVLPPSYAAYLGDNRERRQAYYSSQDFTLRAKVLYPSVQPEDLNTPRDPRADMTWPPEYDVGTIRPGRMARGQESNGKLARVLAQIGILTGRTVHLPESLPPAPVFIDHSAELLGPDTPSSAYSGVYYPPTHQAVVTFHDELEKTLIDALTEARARSRKDAGAESVAERLARARNGQMDSGDVESLAGDIAEYLQTNYKYSLTSEMTHNVDPMIDFLQYHKGKEAGHCEYFASAMVLLCRVAGLNARMVTGFHGGEYIADSQALLVRQRDAHAWVEVMVPERGWMMFDPTPAAESKAGWSSAWMKKIRDFFQSIQSNWLSKVVAFDTSTQRYIIDAAHQKLNDLTAWMKNTAAEVWLGLREIALSGQASWKAQVAVAIGFLWCALAGMWLIRKWHRRRTSLVAQIIKQLDPKTQRVLEHELEFFDDLLRLLGRTGDPKARNLTPREYVEHLAPRLGPATSEALWLVDLFYAIRFGQTHLTPAISANVHTRLATVREQMACAHP